MSDTESVAQWLDELYARVQFVEGVIAAPPLDPGPALYSFLDHCDRLATDLDKAVQMGIAAGMGMENCSCLFHALNGEAEPYDFILKARIEINSLSIFVRQHGDVADWRQYKAGVAMTLLGLKSYDTLGKHAASPAKPYIEKISDSHYRIDHNHPFIKARLEK